MSGANGGLHAVQDPLAKAIAGAAGQEAEGPTVEMAGPIQLTLSTGRPAVLFVPIDITPLEALSVINGVLQITAQLNAKRAAPSPLLRAARIPQSILPKSLRRAR